MLTRLLRRLAWLARQRRHDRDLRDEMAFHRDMLVQHSDGEGPRAMGNVTLAREDARAVWAGRWIDQAWQDARYTVRSMFRQPGFALTGMTGRAKPGWRNIERTV